MHQPMSALCQTLYSYCKKNGHLSRRQTTMKSATDLPNGDLKYLRERRFAQPKLSAVVGRIIDRLAHPRCYLDLEGFGQARPSRRR